MKRWWNTPGYPASARVTRRRVGRALTRVVTIGALSLPIATPLYSVRCIPIGSSVFCFPEGPLSVPRTGGAVIQAWAFGTLSGTTNPNSQEECDFDHVCALAISADGGVGTGTGATLKTSVGSVAQVDPQSNLPFTMTETIDYGHPVTKGVHGNNGGGACYPANGTMTIAIDPSSNLVLDMVGQACQVGNNSNQLLFTGSYVTDPSSSGTVAKADAIGSVNINSPSGLPGTGTTVKASLVGQLTYGN